MKVCGCWCVQYVRGVTCGCVRGRTAHVAVNSHAVRPATAVRSWGDGVLIPWLEMTMAVSVLVTARQPHVHAARGLLHYSAGVLIPGGRALLTKGGLGAAITRAQRVWDLKTTSNLSKSTQKI